MSIQTAEKLMKADTMTRFNYIKSKSCDHDAVNLYRAAKEEGFNSVYDLIEANSFDSVVTSVCTNCGNLDQMEPDQCAGHCEGCKQNTQVSVLILAGLI